MGKELRESRLLASSGRGRVFTQFLIHKLTLLSTYFAFGFLSGGAYALFSICAKDNRGHGRPTRKAQSPRLMNGGRPPDMTLSDALKGSLSFSSQSFSALLCCSYADIDKDAIVIGKTEGRADGRGTDLSVLSPILTLPPLILPLPACLLPSLVALVNQAYLQA